MSIEPKDVHGMVVDFGKHKGELWTRVPLGYLKWILNELEKDKPAYEIANAELLRRGGTMPKNVEITNHAIDRASLRVRKQWHQDRGEDEGIYSWLARICEEALAIKNKNGDQNERMKYKGCVLIFRYGHHFPTLKTVMSDKKWKANE